MALPYHPQFVTAVIPGMPPAFYGWALRLVDGLNSILSGKLNATGEAIRLAANADNTVLTDARISPFSVILFMPITADAATEFAAGSMYVISQTSGTAIIAHANGASTSRDFRYLVIA